MTSITGARAVAEVIARMDDPLVVGMPGGHMIQVFDALRDFGGEVRTCLVREESLATVMAEAHGRLNGSPAIVMGQGAWVLGNAGIGTMEAVLGSSPMVLLVDATEGGSWSHHGPYQAGLGGWGAYDLVAALRATTKEVFVAYDATQALQMTQLAVKHSLAGEPGPVAVVFHSRSLLERIDPASQPRHFLDGNYRSEPPVASPSALAKLLDDLVHATAPVIYAGSGVRVGGAENALCNLVESTGIPVVTSSAGKGTFPEEHPLSAGVIGTFGHPSANRILGEADFVLVVGSKLNPIDTMNGSPALLDPDRQVLAQIDVESRNAAWTFPVHHAIVGDAATTLDSLRAKLDKKWSDMTSRVADVKREHGQFRPRRAEGFGGRTVAAILSDVLPAGTVVTCDAGENRLFLLHDYLSKPGGTVLQPNGGGGMGYAVPAAMSAALSGHPAVAVCGDGGFSMTLHGLLSAQELHLTMTIVVIDNQMLGWVYHGQGERPFASQFSPFRYAAIAQSAGCRAVEVTTEVGFRDALVATQGERGVSVIVAKVHANDRYQDIISDLAGFDVEAVGPSDGKENQVTSDV